MLCVISYQRRSNLTGGEVLKNKKKGCSTQELIGIKTFTKYGLKVGKQEMLFFLVQPTNISVLSPENIEIKVHHLQMVLSALPDMEVACTDSCECFDDNRYYIKDRIEQETNPKVVDILKKDLNFIDNIRTETSTARQFLFTLHCKSTKPEQLMSLVNRTEKIIADQGFEVQRMQKRDIKRFLAIYFDASMDGDKMPDYDGKQFFEINDSK